MKSESRGRGVGDRLEPELRVVRLVLLERVGDQRLDGTQLKSERLLALLCSPASPLFILGQIHLRVGRERAADRAHDVGQVDVRQAVLSGPCSHKTRDDVAILDHHYAIAPRLRDLVALVVQLARERVEVGARYVILLLIALV